MIRNGQADPAIRQSTYRALESGAFSRDLSQHIVEDANASKSGMDHVYTCIRNTYAIHDLDHALTTRTVMDPTVCPPKETATLSLPVH